MLAEGNCGITHHHSLWKRDFGIWLLFVALLNDILAIYVHIVYVYIENTIYRHIMIEQTNEINKANNLEINEIMNNRKRKNSFLKTEHLNLAALCVRQTRVREHLKCPSR